MIVVICIVLSQHVGCVGRLCETEGCQKMALRGGKCWAHGGGMYPKVFTDSSAIRKTNG